MQFPVELPAVTVEDDWGSEDDRDSQCEWPKWKKDAKSRIPQGFSQFHRTQVKEVSVDKLSLKYLIGYSDMNQKGDAPNYSSISRTEREFQVSKSSSLFPLDRS